jgi:hypothetical protein
VDARQYEALYGASSHVIDGSEIDTFDRHTAFHGYGSEDGF